MKRLDLTKFRDLANRTNALEEKTRTASANLFLKFLEGKITPAERAKFRALSGLQDITTTITLECFDEHLHNIITIIFLDTTIKKLKTEKETLKAEAEKRIEALSQYIKKVDKYNKYLTASLALLDELIDLLEEVNTSVEEEG